MAIAEQRQLGRAKNAILGFFEKRLSVPKIYIDANWNGTQLDVLAIDRDGVGDVHAVLLYNRIYNGENFLDVPAEQQTLTQLIERFAFVPAQYKYIGAIHSFSTDDYERRDVMRNGLPTAFFEDSFANDGVGRVGFISVAAPIRGDLTAVLEVKPERFRAAIAELADEYVRSHSPDWEIRA